MQISNGVNNKKPKLTVISPSLNTGRFLRDTINSIFNQSYKDFEYIVIDGGSTDETIGILKEYPQIRWISEKDSGYFEAMRKGLAMAQGDYIMHCCISDGYLDKDWFQKCVDALDNDKEISLVWGYTRAMSEEGKLYQELPYSQFYKFIPPQKTEFIYYWLSAYFAHPLENICVRKNVLEECFPLYNRDKVDQLEPWLEFYYKFHTRGYLPYFIPAVASFFRFHKDQLGEREGRMKTEGGNYLKKIQLYKRKVIFGMITHQYRNGAGELLPYKFSLSKFIIREVFSLAPLINLVRFSTRDFDFLRKKKSLLRIFKFIKRIYYKLFRVVYGCKGINK